MRFDFNAQLLKVLHDGAINGSTEVSVFIRDSASFITNLVVYVLEGLSNVC